MYETVNVKLYDANICIMQYVLWYIIIMPQTLVGIFFTLFALFMFKNTMNIKLTLKIIRYLTKYRKNCIRHLDHLIV